jgi:hypothetical protein
MTTENNREYMVLSKVAKGEISPEEAAGELDTLQLQEEKPQPSFIMAADAEDHKGELPKSELRRFSQWNDWWIVPYGFSVVFTGLGAIWLYQGWMARHFGFGFWMAWIPFAAGIGGMALSWRARVSRWMHMRIRFRHGSHPSLMRLSFPLPTRLIKWISRNFGIFFPDQIRGVDLDECMDALENSVNDETPIYIWVDDEKEGQQVEIWIGGR